MPSIEIICIGQEKSTDCSFLPFPIEIESELVSHRSPAPLFQSDFDRLDGYIYHFLDGEGPTAYNLLIKDWYDTDENPNGFDDNVEFKDKYKDSIKLLFDTLLSSSKTDQLLFTSDYQFGPEKILRFGSVSVTEFWDLHDAGKIRMNASYLIIKNEKSL